MMQRLCTGQFYFYA